MGDGHLEVAGEVEEVQVAVVVDRGEETGVRGMPGHVVDVVFGVFESAEGLFGIGVP